MLSHNEYIGRIDAKELQQYANAIASLEACFEGAKDKKEKAYYKAKIDKGNRYLNSYNEMEVKGRILLKLYTQSFTIFPGFYRDNYTHITDENGGRCLQDIRYIEVEGSGGWRNWYYFYTLTAGELYGKIRDMIKNELGIEEKQYIASTPQKEKKNITAQYQF